MMDNSRPSLLPIITSVIGSGLLLFVLNNTAADVNLPHIYLQVNSSSIYDNKQIKFQTVAINDGRSTATHVRLTLSYPSSNITNSTIPFSNENITSIKYENPSTLVVELQRLSIEASIIINTTTIKKNTVTTGALVNNLYVVSAASDQGTNTISDSSLPTIRIEDAGIIPFKLRLIVVASILATICFLIVLSHKRIKNYKSQINRSQFVFGIIKQMISVREVFKNNIHATDIFSLSIWDSMDNEGKRQIFIDHRDYNLISKFYSKLRQRDSDFSKEINEDILKNLNQDCLNLVDYTLKNIIWKKYRVTSHKRLHFIININATLISALVIYFIFEVLRIIFFLQFHSMFGLFNNMYYIFTLVSRGLVSFFVSREIIIYQSSYTYDISANNDTIYYTSLSSTRHGLIKLFAFSFLIMGVPLFLTGSQLHFFDRSDTTFQFFIVILLIDLIRMLILSFIIPKYIFKNTLNIK
jgi:hypothetical protein